MSQVLGLNFASALDGAPMTVHMPGPPVTTEALYLTQPVEIRARFDLVGDGWGFRPPETTDLVVVNRVGFTARISDYQVVGDEMNDWTLLFLSWLDILTGQHLTPIGFRPPQQATNRTCLMIRESDGMLLHGNVYRPFPKVYQLSQFDATTELLEHAYTLAGVKEPVPVAWMLLRDARALHRVTQTRRAVIECGSAAEMAIKSLLDARSVSWSPNKTLGPLSALLKKSGYPLDSDFQSAFLNVRNREVHMNTGWGAVTESESLRMLAISTKLVSDAFPLPRGIQITW